MFSFSGLKIPVIQAPMAGGPGTPALAAAAANAGGVGSLGFAYSTQEQIGADLKATRALTRGPLNANFFIFKPVELPDERVCKGILAAQPGLTGIVLKIPQAPFFHALADQLEPVWELKPEILSFHFGVPPQHFIDKAHTLGIAVGITATNLAESLAIEKAGADFIVAQGVEAGGHYGMFDVRDVDAGLPLHELLNELRGKTRLPLVAAGGIMNGADIRRALQAGAAAVQMGTAFLTCRESGATQAHRNFILTQKQRGTAMTKAYSGRMARGITTEFMKAMEGKPVLPFPIQNSLTKPVRAEAIKNNNGEFQSLWAGTNYASCRDESVAELMARLANEIKAA